MFAWMESAPATVYTITLGDDQGTNLVVFIRSPETIDNFTNEFRRITKAFDSTN